MPSPPCPSPCHQGKWSSKKGKASLSSCLWASTHNQGDNPFPGVVDLSYWVGQELSSPLGRMWQLLGDSLTRCPRSYSSAELSPSKRYNWAVTVELLNIDKVLWLPSSRSASHWATSAELPGMPGNHRQALGDVIHTCLTESPTLSPQR